MGMGVHVEYAFARHTSMMEWMAHGYGVVPYTSGAITLLGGSAQTEGEAEQFECVIDTYQPKDAVIMAPLGLDLDRTKWGNVYIADGSHHGDVLDGVWKIGMKHLVPIHCFVGDPVNRPCARFGANIDSAGQTIAEMEEK